MLLEMLLFSSHYPDIYDIDPSRRHDQYCYDLKFSVILILRLPDALFLSRLGYTR